MPLVKLFFVSEILTIGFVGFLSAKINLFINGICFIWRLNGSIGFSFITRFSF